MIFILKNPFDVEKFRNWCEGVIDRQATVECRRKYPPRSIAQNNYLHVILTYFASEFGYSTDEVKQDLFKRQVNASIFVHERINKRGQTVSYLRSTTDLDTAEMTVAIERFRNWSASEQGLYLPEPHEGAFLYAQQQAERWEEFA